MWCVNVLLVFLTFFVLGQDPTEIVFGKSKLTKFSQILLKLMT